MKKRARWCPFIIRDALGASRIEKITPQIALWLAAGRPDSHDAVWMYWKAMERVHELEALVERLTKVLKWGHLKAAARSILDKKVQIAGSIATDSKMAPNRPVSHHVKMRKDMPNKVKRRRKTDAKPPHI